MNTTVRVEVSFGDDPQIVTVRMSGRSDPIIGSVIATDQNSDGETRRIFLREKIHQSSESINWEGWVLSGATTSVLTRIGARS